VDVESGELLRAWQPTNGLQVYSDWKHSIENPHELDVPDHCFKFRCVDNPGRQQEQQQPELPVLVQQTESDTEEANKKPACPFASLMNTESRPNDRDQQRAFQRRPALEFRGHNHAHMAHVLNGHLSEYVH
jgi:hypothetical protein